MTKFIKLNVEQIMRNQFCLLTSRLLPTCFQIFWLHGLLLNRNFLTSLVALSAILLSFFIYCVAGGLFGYFEGGLLFIFFRFQKFSLLRNRLRGITALFFVKLFSTLSLKVDWQSFLRN